MRSKVPSYFDFALSYLEAVGCNFWMNKSTTRHLSSKRCPRDIEENEYEPSLLVLCSSFDLYVLNRKKCDGDTDGLYNYTSTAGNSVLTILYFLALSVLCLGKNASVGKN